MRYQTIPRPNRPIFKTGVWIQLKVSILVGACVVCFDALNHTWARAHTPTETNKLLYAAAVWERTGGQKFGSSLNQPQCEWTSIHVPITRYMYWYACVATVCVQVCCICLARYLDNDELRELPCTHFFHAECVDKWLAINALCPLCKSEVANASGASAFFSSSTRRLSDWRTGNGADARVWFSSDGYGTGFYELACWFLMYVNIYGRILKSISFNCCVWFHTYRCQNVWVKTGCPSAKKNPQYF